MTIHEMSSLDPLPDTSSGAARMDDDPFRKLAEAARLPVVPGPNPFRAARLREPPRAILPPDLPAPTLRFLPSNSQRVWESLVPVTLDRLRLLGNGVFLDASEDPAALAFDMLRTRALQVMQDRGWRRLAVTAPSEGCGTSLVTANLALSLARRPASRTLAVDLNLRSPGLARTFALRETQALHDVLTGAQPLEAHALRHGATLALALNGVTVADPGACLQSADTAAALGSMVEHLNPEIALYDLPPALVADDALAVAHAMDAVLLVVDGTRTKADEITACERLFEGRLPILGMVLNRAQDFGLLPHPFRRRRR